MTEQFCAGCTAHWHATKMQEENKYLRKLVSNAWNERDHWKANHDNQVRRARILIERDDLPIERVKAYDHMCKMQAVVDAAVKLVSAPAWAGVSDEDVLLEVALKEGGFLK